MVKEENLSAEKTERLIENYLFAEEEPLRDEVLELLDGEKPRLLQWRKLGDHLLLRIKEFVDIFMSGGSRLINNFIDYYVFLTLQDPNYIVAGSRDPLGFQVQWQGAGRKLIPELSTVSDNLRDFHIIGLAKACSTVFGIANKDYPAFFLCFEQLMAYARLAKFAGEESLNGMDRARKIMDDGREHVEISLSSQLLSNQKSYGIWASIVDLLMA